MILFPAENEKDRFQDFRFSSFPRQRESSKLLKRLDTHFHGYDDTQFMSESSGFDGWEPMSLNRRSLPA